MIEKILEKRQKIKKRLFKKVNLLRKKSASLLVKGKQLLGQIKQDRNILLTRSQKLLVKKSELITKNKQLLTKYSNLKNQKQKLRDQFLLLQKTGNELIKQKTNFIEQLNASKQKLEEFKQFNQIGQEILKFKQEMKNQGKNVWAVPYENLVELSKSNESWIVPNPSTEILTKIINTMKLKYEKNITSLTNLTLDQKTVEGTNRLKSVTNNTVIISQLLNKLTDYLPFIQIYMKTVQGHAPPRPPQLPAQVAEQRAQARQPQ
jgi:hypothetical protein